ncbi:MAG: tetratricopeptide repeat protein [Terracidiphilus sp.]|jgi:TPR repeat protein
MISQPVEEPMRKYSKPLALAILFLSQLTSALAQTAGTGTTEIDLALLAKANGGDAPAQVQMGDNSCAAGNKATHDPQQLAEYYKVAATWYRKAAEQGSLTGQLHLAALYRDGRGVPRDMAQAAEWYHKAAEQGDTGAQATLGVLYSIGQGIPQSYGEAYYWFDLASRVKGPSQEKYAAYRQMSGTHITADELADVQQRAAKWLASHPR